VLQHCADSGIGVPLIWVFSAHIPAPLAFTCKFAPHGKIMISRRLLEQLADDEIGIYAGQLGHIAHWDFVVISLVTLITNCTSFINKCLSGRRTNISLHLTAAAISSLAYGIWWLLSSCAFMAISRCNATAIASLLKS